MSNRDKQFEIIKELNDNRSKLSALFSLYNSLLLQAETDRTELTNYYDQMIDLRNSANEISNLIVSVKKAERATVFNKNKSKIKQLYAEVKDVKSNFAGACSNYRLALQDCGSLKTEYKHAVSQLCKDFKATVDDDTDVLIIKGYKQQVKIIKAILDKIEQIVADYNVKRNRMEADSEKFQELSSSVSLLLDKMENIA